MKKLVYILVLTFMCSNTVFAEIAEFIMQSNDIGQVSGDHGGRPYHVFNDGDEAVYITASDWQGGHDPDQHGVWPISDGYISWPTFTDPNGVSDRPEVITTDRTGQTLYVYQDMFTEQYELYASPDLASADLHKLYYDYWAANGALNLGNNGVPSGGFSDRQNAIITEFDLKRPYQHGLKGENLESAYLEITIDRVVDMTLSGHNTSLIPSKLFVNSFAGDGVVGIYENAQEDFDRIDPNNADAEIWLTLDGTDSGMSITDFSLSWYKLIDPGEGLPFTFRIDVTDSVLAMLGEDADYAGFVLSGSPDGDFTLASVDLVNSNTGISYLPKLIITADVEPLVSDLDSNLKVDIFDFAKLSSTWLSYDTDSDYDSVCDISDPVDGIIDIKDMVVFLNQWLEDRNR